MASRISYVHVASTNTQKSIRLAIFVFIVAKIDFFSGLSVFLIWTFGPKVVFGLYIRVECCKVDADATCVGFGRPSFWHLTTQSMGNCCYIVAIALSGESCGVLQVTCASYYWWSYTMLVRAVPDRCKYCDRQGKNTTRPRHSHIAKTIANDHTTTYSTTNYARFLVSAHHSRRSFSVFIKDHSAHSMRQQK